MSGKFEAPKGLPTVFDPSYKGVGQKPGLEIWRVEKLKVVKKATTDPCYQGQLHMGDCYIVLQTKMRENALERHIFFWLGGESSQDEQGCAAYKTVELDQSLGGEPVQHREVQGHETDEFLALFKPNGLRYLEGGVETGFKHVDRDAFTTRLLHIKGRRNIRVQQVEAKASSMNHGDVFILDAGREIFQWNGKDSSTVERQKGLEVTRQIRDQERSGRANIVVIDSGKDDDSKFFEKLGDKKSAVKSTADGGDDAAHNRNMMANTKLFHISDASGKVNVNEVQAENGFTKEMLDTNDAYILDVAGTAIYAWIGRKASEQEKLHSMRIATDFLKQKGYPNWTPVTRIVEGAETPLFKQNFKVWPEKDALMPGAKPKAKAKPARASFSVGSMHQQGTRETEGMVDDGSGTIQIWRIENFEPVEYPKDLYGHFFDGDCFIVFYTYLVNSKENYIIYFWQGLNSSQDERGASAAHTVALDEKYGGAPVQVRVVQNKEPPHFLLLFKGKMVVHAGGKASGFKNRQDLDSFDTDGTRLFQIRGTSQLNTRALQVPEVAASLNSGDVFLLESPKQNWMWCGMGCSGDERELAKSIQKSISNREFQLITEGSETSEFWAALGGKTEYANTKAALEDDVRDPRLFQCSNVTGQFMVEEIFDFDQEDLIEDDVMLLDTHYEVFVWIGKGANFEEKKNALSTAMEYIKTDPSGRTVDDTVLIQIKQGFEPPSFTCHFHGWNPNKWSEGKTYAQLKAELEAGGGDAAALSVDVKTALDNYSNATYSYEVLTGPNIPENVDKTKKEQYLSNEEFQQIFKMSKAEFNAMPAWKGSNLKKKVKLF